MGGNKYSSVVRSSGTGRREIKLACAKILFWVQNPFFLQAKQFNSNVKELNNAKVRQQIMHVYCQTIACDVTPT